MPHSSGGGSSHSGSHHSSGGSGGSISFGGGSSTRVSRNYFGGSRMYVRYNNRRPEYYYSNRASLGPSKYQIVMICMIMIPFILSSLLSMLTAFQFAAKLSASGVDKLDVEIVDEINVLGDTSRLRESLNTFKETTGIIPVVVTIDQAVWKNDNYSLEQYAYNYYVFNFTDEKHWLILYSENDSNTGTFGEWSWEGMQGDDTDVIINQKIADEFTDTLHNNFLRASNTTKADAIADAFDSITPGIMGLRVDASKLVGGVFQMFIPAIFIIVSVSGYKSTKKKYEGFEEVKGAQMQPNNIPLEDTCKYCDGVYVVGTVIKCPHCDAPIPAHNPINNNTAY